MSVLTDDQAREAVMNEGTVDPAWLTSPEAFEVAWRGARTCGVGKVSPAQLTAALNALSDHLGGLYEASSTFPRQRRSLPGEDHD